MDNKTYLVESSRSVAPEIHTNCTPIESGILRKAFMDMIVAGELCDSIKRKLFYGLGHISKGVPFNVMHLERMSGEQILGQLKQYASHFEANDLIHGILGAAGESGELLDALTAAILEQKEIDKVNVVEEVGDVLWYLALVLRSVDSTLEEAMQININKLRKRYPEQWSQEAVVNRDLEGEREILEKGIDTA